jgi:transcriptional regulator with XRE-family HTH domain
MQAAKTDQDKTVAERFIEMRKMVGLSQKQLNRLAGFGHGHLSRIEGGLRKRLRNSTVDAVISALVLEGWAVSGRWLRTGIGPRPQRTPGGKVNKKG